MHCPIPNIQHTFFSDAHYAHFCGLSMAEQITTSSVIEVCIFGVGRAGTIHLKNLLTNPRARVIYIVEQDTKRADDLCATYRLEHTKVLAAADADTVFEDSRWATWWARVFRTSYDIS